MGTPRRGTPFTLPLKQAAIAAHGTTEGADKTKHATGHATKGSGAGVKKSAHGIGHGVKKGATKTADALK